MSYKVVGRILTHSSATATTRCALVAVGHCAHEDNVLGDPRIGVGDLAALAGCDVRSFQRAVTWLTDARELVYARAAGRGRTGAFGVTVGLGEAERSVVLVRVRNRATAMTGGRFDWLGLTPDEAARLGVDTPAAEEKRRQAVTFSGDEKAADRSEKVTDRRLFSPLPVFVFPESRSKQQQAGPVGQQAGLTAGRAEGFDARYRALLGLGVYAQVAERICLTEDPEWVDVVAATVRRLVEAERARGVTLPAVGGLVVRIVEGKHPLPEVAATAPTVTPASSAPDVPGRPLDEATRASVFAMMEAEKLKTLAGGAGEPAT